MFQTIIIVYIILLAIYIVLLLSIVTSPEQSLREARVSYLYDKLETLSDSGEDKLRRFVIYNILDRLHSEDERADGASVLISIVAEGISNIMICKIAASNSISSEKVHEIWEEIRKEVENVKL